MLTKKFFSRGLAWAMIVMLAIPPPMLFAQQAEQAVFQQEELEQLLAPIALHPDSLVSQILMASTYPLEVVQAERFAKQNAKLKGDALTAALESGLIAQGHGDEDMSSLARAIRQLSALDG